MNVSVLGTKGILKRATSLLLEESLLSLEKIISFHRQLDAQQLHHQDDTYAKNSHKCIGKHQKPSPQKSQGHNHLKP